ncbi:MAG: response regulator [Deltaproteobacteria bacterium]|nr:response regulator [Deltaproteobacteria bacterium]
MTSDATAVPATHLIVCVDDDLDMLAAIVRTLRNAAFTILQTSDPLEALEWVTTRNVAVLVSDYDMPVMTGAELAIAVQRVRGETVRVLVTGRKAIELAPELVFRCVHKPFDTLAFRRVVAEAVTRHTELVASGARDCQT